jgi:hypothetical protein
MSDPTYTQLPSTEDSNATFPTPEENARNLADFAAIARGLGWYARERMSEHDHRLALERELRPKALSPRGLPRAGDA